MSSSPSGLGSHRRLSSIGLAACALSLLVACSASESEGVTTAAPNDQVPATTSASAPTTSSASLSTTPIASSADPLVSTTSPAASSGSDDPGLTLVALGDSIPYNSPDDCLNCTGYVEQYGDTIAAATGDPVQLVDHAQHDGVPSDGR